MHCDLTLAMQQACFLTPQGFQCIIAFRPWAWIGFHFAAAFLASRIFISHKRTQCHPCRSHGILQDWQNQLKMVYIFLVNMQSKLLWWTYYADVEKYQKNQNSVYLVLQYISHQYLILLQLCKHFG